MKRLTIGHLQFAVVGRTLFIDWRMPEVGSRWRLSVSTRPLWIPMGQPRPTCHSRWPSPIFWAFWARGNE